MRTPWLCLMRIPDSVLWEPLTLSYEKPWLCLMRIPDSVLWESLTHLMRTPWLCLLRTPWLCLMRIPDSVLYIHKRRGIYVCFKSFELIAAGAFHPVFFWLPTMTRLKFKYRACYLVFYLVKKEQLISLTRLSFNKKIPSSDIYVGKICGKS